MRPTRLLLLDMLDSVAEIIQTLPRTKSSFDANYANNIVQMLKKLKDLSNINPDLLSYIIGAGYGGTYSLRGGSSSGPDRIMHIYNNNLESFDRFTLNEPENMFDVGHFDISNIDSLTPERAVETISEVLNKINDKFFVVLGGTHTVSNGSFLYISQKHNPNDVTILQIDAHPDLRTTAGDYKIESSKFDHACVMRRAIEIGFNVVQVGIRTYSIYEHECMLANRDKIKVFEWGKGPTPTVEDILKSMKTDKVYLTFDIDGLDPSFAPATGTPIPGGLDFFYAQELIRKLIFQKDLIGADIVEVAPFDDDVLTEYTAAQLCYNLISYRGLKDLGLLDFKCI